MATVDTIRVRTSKEWRKDNARLVKLVDTASGNTNKKLGNEMNKEKKKSRQGPRMLIGDKKERGQSGQKQTGINQKGGKQKGIKA